MNSNCAKPAVARGYFPIKSLYSRVLSVPVYPLTNSYRYNGELVCSEEFKSKFYDHNGLRMFASGFYVWHGG
jgi:hypothetical protein